MTRIDISSSASDASVKKLPLKNGFHADNVFRQAYDWDQLLRVQPTLRKHLKLSPRGERTLEFSDREALILLNQALLRFHFGLEHWHLPPHALCPPIPSRWDYLLRLNELIRTNSNRHLPLRGWDIGCGSSLVYTLLAHLGLNASMVGSDISEASIRHGNSMLKENQIPAHAIDLRLQPVAHQLFEGILEPDEQFDFCVCNPPFHASAKEAESAARRKIKHLALPSDHDLSAFAGQSNELWCKGGEQGFLKKLLKESVKFSPQIRWFSSLVSKAENVDPMLKFLKKHQATAMEVLPLEQGNKKSRIVAWSFQ